MPLVLEGGEIHTYPQLPIIIKIVDFKAGFFFVKLILTSMYVLLYRLVEPDNCKHSFFYCGVAWRPNDIG